MNPNPITQPKSAITRTQSSVPFAGWLRTGALVLLLAAMAPASARAQANAAPPQLIAYQGFLTDGTGTALATNAPKNYDVVFRIWNDPLLTAVTNRLWTEEQVVTVDRGNFSVLLGQGSQYTNEVRPVLSSLFAASDASSRYVEITVRGIGVGGTDVRIQPRLRLLSAPYAFTASSAGQLVNANGAVVVSNNASGVSVTGGLNVVGGAISANSVSAALLNGSLYGSNVVAGSLSGAQLAPGTVGAAQIANGAVGNAQIATGAVGAAQIANGAVGSAQIASGAVGSTQIASGAVGSTQIASGAVGSAQLAPGSVGAAAIATNLAVWTVTPTNIYYNASDVSIGTSNNARSLTVTSNLTVNGSLNVAGGKSINIGGTNYPGQTVQFYSTNVSGASSANWTLLPPIDVSAFAHRPDGFKMTIYWQYQTGNWETRMQTGTFYLEQPGFTLNNTTFPLTSVHGSVTWHGYGSDSLQFFYFGSPYGSISYDIIYNNYGIYVSDYYPGADLGFPAPNNNNTKAAYTQYLLYVAFSAGWNGYVIISNN